MIRIRRITVIGLVAMSFTVGQWTSRALHPVSAAPMRTEATLKCGSYLTEDDAMNPTLVAFSGKRIVYKCSSGGPWHTRYKVTILGHVAEDSAGHLRLVKFVRHPSGFVTVVYRQRSCCYIR